MVGVAARIPADDTQAIVRHKESVIWSLTRAYDRDVAIGEAAATLGPVRRPLRTVTCDRVGVT
jgi:hypothetical protein